MLDSKRGLLPFRHGIHLSKTMSPKTSEEMAEMAKVPYASAIGEGYVLWRTMKMRNLKFFIACNICINTYHKHAHRSHHMHSYIAKHA